MSPLQAQKIPQDYITPPLSVVSQPWTPPAANVEVLRVITLLRQIRDGQHDEGPAWREFQVGPDAYNFLERTLQEDTALGAFVANKIRYDYYEDEDRLVVLMPTKLHEAFNAYVEHQIIHQLSEIRNGAGQKALFARKIRPLASADVQSPDSRSKKSPDAQFVHVNARFPGVIIETAFSEKKKHLERKAESYLLGSNANIRAVVCITVNYERTKSRHARLSVWRPQICETANGRKLRAVEEDAQEFRDSEGHATDCVGLRLWLHEFTNKEIAEAELGDEQSHIIYISGLQLCKELDEIEAYIENPALHEMPLDTGVEKWPRSPTPPEQVTASDEERFVAEEERIQQQVDREDIDYEHE